ncbi:hypothetical protein SMMN14_04838 [Sphaerulina musiva]
MKSKLRTKMGNCFSSSTKTKTESIFHIAPATMPKLAIPRDHPSHPDEETSPTPRRLAVEWDDGIERESSMKIKKRIARTRMRQVPEPLQSPLFDTPLRDSRSFSAYVWEQLERLDEACGGAGTISRITTADGSLGQRRRKGIRFEGVDSEGKSILTSSAETITSFTTGLRLWFKLMLVFLLKSTLLLPGMAIVI